MRRGIDPVRVGYRRARTAWRLVREAVAQARHGSAPPASAREAARGPLKVHAGLLPQRIGRNVVVLADDTLNRSLLRQYLAGLPADNVTILGGPGDLTATSPVHAVVASTSAQDDTDWFVGNGPFDIVIDLRDPHAESRQSRWVRLFLHLRPRGVWIVPRQAVTGDIRVTERRWLVALANGATKEVVPGNGGLPTEAMRAVAGVFVRPGIVIIEKRLAHVIKLRDHEIMTVLPRRDPQIQIDEITVLPAQMFHSRARVVSHESSVAVTGLETDIPVPQMSLRHYRGPIAFSGQTLMFAKNSVLADSFRFYHALDDVQGGFAHHKLHHYGARLARVHPGKVPIESLPGDYYQLDPQFTGHFGHIMTEVIARLWGWDDAKARLPELKVLMWASRPKGKIGVSADATASFERTILNAYGIANEDIVLLPRPAYVHSLVSATMMWHNWSPYFVHPAIRDVWNRIAANVIDPAGPSHERIFVSRPQHHWRRRCVNGPEVEALFAANGFTIVYPEKLTVGEQAALFANATTIAGYGGSGLFNLIYAQQVQTVIILNQESYTARNEHLFTAVLGCEVHYFWSAAQSADAGQEWTFDAYESEWMFDFARNERELTTLLGSL